MRFSTATSLLFAETLEFVIGFGCACHVPQWFRRIMLIFVNNLRWRGCIEVRPRKKGACSMQNASNQMWWDPWLNKGLRNVTQLISRQAPFFHVDLFNLISTFGFFANRSPASC